MAQSNADEPVPRKSRRGGLLIYVAISVIGVGAGLIALMPADHRALPAAEDIIASPAIPASAAHSPAISLVRYLAVGQGNDIKGQDAAGYWHLMVSAMSTADAPIEVATVTCTLFDSADQPLGNGDAAFHNILPGAKIWEDVPIRSAKPPSTAACHFDVAYNSN